METLQRTANRGSVSTGAYEIDNSCVFEDANSEGLHKSLSSQSQDCFTISFWLKRTGLGAQRLVGAGADGNNEVIIHFTSSDQLEFYAWESAYRMRYKTNRVFRDTSAFYHFAFLVDTRLSTASERTQIYVNGVLETSFSVSVVPGQNALFDWTTNIQVGRGGPSADADMSGYLAEFVYLDDTKAAHTDLGEFDSDTGIWIPKDVSGLTFGTNGAYLDFKDSSNMGNDANGGTDFTLVNISSADQSTDTPTNNFATFNALQPLQASGVISEGATKFYTGSNWQTAVSSIAVSSGKWYAEFYPNSSTTIVGFVDVEDAYIPQNHTGYYLGYAGGNQNRSVGMQGSNGVIMNDNNSATGAGFVGGNIVSLALDMDNRKAYWAVNGTYVNSGDPANGTNGVTWATSSTLGDLWTDVITMGVTGYTNIIWLGNFGGFTTMPISSGNADGNGYGNFEYAPPSGFYSICSKNLAEFGGTA